MFSKKAHNTYEILNMKAIGVSKNMQFDILQIIRRNLQIIRTYFKPFFFIHYHSINRSFHEQVRNQFVAHIRRFTRTFVYRKSSDFCFLFISTKRNVNIAPRKPHFVISVFQKCSSYCIAAINRILCDDFPYHSVSFLRS